MPRTMPFPRRAIPFYLAAALALFCAPRAARAQDPLDPPYPRALNGGRLGAQEAITDFSDFAACAGAVAPVSSESAVANADAFKQAFGGAKALIARVEWRGKNPAESAAGFTGPALSAARAAYLACFPGARVIRRSGTSAPQIIVQSVEPFEPGDVIFFLPAGFQPGAPPDFTFHPTEFAVVESIEPEGYEGLPTLNTRRAQFGSQAVDVGQGAWAIPLARTGAAGELWAWNLSLGAPRDANLRRAYEVLGDWLAAWITTAHPAWDGLWLADAQWSLDSGAALPARRRDTNGDASPDSGWISGDNHWGLGQLEFAARLRQKAGESKALIAGFDPLAPSPWPDPGAASGLWIERFPEGAPGGDFDSAFEWLRFFAARAAAAGRQRPCAVVSTRAATRAYGGGESNAPFRLGAAAACLADAWHVYSALPDPAAQDTAIYGWDEYTGGALARPGWLGRPLEAPVRHTSHLARLAGPLPSTGWTLEIRSGSGAAAQGPVVDTQSFPPGDPGAASLRVDVTAAGAPVPRLDDVTLRGPEAFEAAPGEVTVRFQARAVNSGALPAPGRDMQVFISVEGAGAVRAGWIPLGGEWREYYLTAPVAAGGIGRVEFQTGGPAGSVWVDQIEVFAGGADCFSRRFQGGAVLLNATAAARAISPGAVFYPLAGEAAPEEDPGVNEGGPGAASFSVPPGDALFVQAAAGAPTPTPVSGATLTPSPTPSPTPVFTSLPTATPRPTYTPLPTLTLVPTPSPTPLPGEYQEVLDAILNRRAIPSDRWPALDKNTDSVIDSADFIRMFQAGGDGRRPRAEARDETRK